MTAFENKIWRAIAFENGMAFIPETMQKDILNFIFTDLINQSKEEALTWDDLADEFDDHPVILFETCKASVLNALEQIAPKAWFKPVFMSREQQKKMGLPVSV